VLFCLMFFFTVNFYAPWTKVPAGISVGGIPAGGLSFDTLARTLASVRPRTQEIRLTAAAESLTVEVETVVDLSATLGSVRAYGRSGSLATRVRAWRLLRGGVDLPVIYALSAASQAKAVEEARQRFERAPGDARLRADGDELSVVPAVEGRAVNVTALEERIAQAVKRGAGAVEVPLIAVAPVVSTADVEAMGITTLMARFTTRFDPGLAARSHNIVLAAGIIDGTLVPPGGRFSFNGTVGPRTQERGFEKALVIQDDAFVPGLGGGVCQVSSTLYRAVLAAGLEVVERHNHSLPVAYIPLGLDATVSYGGQDLVFVNNTSHYVLLTMQVSQDGELTARVFGGTSPVPVSFETVTTEVEAPPVRYLPDPSLGPGQLKVVDKGQYGRTVETYAVYPDGRRRLVSVSRYRPLPVQVLVGPGG